MTMNEFFQNYEIVVMQDNSEQGTLINNMALFQSHPEFNGEVHIFKPGEEVSVASVLSISKSALVRSIKAYSPGNEAPKHVLQ